MKFHGIQMTGKFIIQKVTSLPTWTTADEGRLIYDITERKMYIGSDQSWTEAGGGGGYGLPITNFVDNGQLEAGKMYMIDTSSGSLDANLEATPNLGDTVTVVDVAGTFNSYPLTVYGNGQTIHQDAALEADIKDVVLIFVWTGASWKLDVGGIVQGGSGSGSIIGEYDSDFTAVSGLTAFVDTRPGIVTVTMPDENTLSTGTEVNIIDQYNYFNTNKVICVSTQAEFENGTSTIELTNDGSKTTFMWDAGTAQWKIDSSVDLNGGIGNIDYVSGSSYNAKPGDFLFLDTSLNPITINLPPSGDLGSKAVISIYDQKDKFDFNNVTINPAFGTIDLGQASYTVHQKGVRVDFIWDDAEEDWKLDIGGDISSVLGSSGGMGGSNPVAAGANMNASVGDFIFCDTSSNTIVITMPDANSLVTGDGISIMDLKGTFNTYNVVVNPVNCTIGDDTSFTADINQMRVDFIYNEEVGNWLMDIGGALVTGTGGGAFNTATESNYGLTRLATPAEVVAGTVDNKVITPASLAGLGLVGATVWTPVDSGQLCVVGSKYMVDTSGGPITMTLPSNPSDGNSIVFSDGADFSANNLIIARNGKTIEDLSEDMIVNTENMSFELVYYNNDWKIA